VSLDIYSTPSVLHLSSLFLPICYPR